MNIVGGYDVSTKLLVCAAKLVIRNNVGCGLCGVSLWCERLLHKLSKPDAGFLDGNATSGQVISNAAKPFHRQRRLFRS